MIRATLFALFAIAVSMQANAGECGNATHRPKIGLVLSGGGALGAAHIGVLKVLEELRVPVDCIAGTSMGSIVGGLYAMGLDAATLEATINSIDWRGMFRDRPPRAERDFRRKLQDDGNLIPFSFGIEEDKPLLPRGLILGQTLTLALRRLSLDGAAVLDFDRLPIPYRAVAADIETGEAVVLEKGDIATAMRASMAVSGVFPPVLRDDRLLVDGALANNTPIDIARAMGADRVIVVDLGTELPKRDQLDSAAAIVGQSINLLLRRNTERQLATLEPTDVLIRPELDGLSATSFDKIAEMIGPGETAARAMTGELRKLSLSPEAYRDLVEGRPNLIARPETLAFVRLDNKSRIDDAVIMERVTVKPGEPFDPEEIEQDVRRIYGLDYFETVTWRLVDVGTERGLEIRVEEKTIGLHTARVGLNLQFDPDAGSRYNLSGQVRLANLNELGAELVTDVSTGQTNQLILAYLQPLDAATKWYLSPSVSLSDREFAQYQDGERLRELRIQQAYTTLALARQFGTSGATAVSFDYGVGQFDLRSGPSIGDDNDFDIARYVVDLGYDSVDDLYFPSTGDLARLNFTHNLDDLGSSTSDITVSGTVATVRSRGQNRLRVQFAGGTLLDGEGSDQNAFTLGGLFFLSGYPQFELSGQNYLFASVAGYRDIGIRSVFFDMPVIVGGTVETGRIWNDGDTDIPQRWSGSLVVGVDSPVGPIFIAYGVGGGDRHVFHFSLGQEF